jgi:hypothetical protein
MSTQKIRIPCQSNGKPLKVGRHARPDDEGDRAPNALVNSTPYSATKETPHTTNRPDLPRLCVDARPTELFESSRRRLRFESFAPNSRSYAKIWLEASSKLVMQMADDSLRDEEIATRISELNNFLELFFGAVKDEA